MRKLFLAPGVIAFGLLAVGCAHSSASVAGARDAEAAYRAVHDGAQPSARAGNLIFCADARALAAYRTDGLGDDWADKVSLEYSRARVRDVLAHDPRLAGASIDVRAVGGGLLLSGRAATDAAAVAAIEDALEVRGVTIVDADLRSPESPGAPTPGRAANCE